MLCIHSQLSPTPNTIGSSTEFLARSFCILLLPLTPPAPLHVNWTAYELGKGGSGPRLRSCCVTQLDHTHTPMERCRQGPLCSLRGACACGRLIPPRRCALAGCGSGSGVLGGGGWDMEAMMPSLSPIQLTTERRDDYARGSITFTSSGTTILFSSGLRGFCGLLGCMPDSGGWSGRGKRKGKARVLSSHAAISDSDDKMDVQSVVRFQDLVLSQASGGGRWRQGEASGSSPFWESRDGGKGGEMRRPEGQPLRAAL